MHIELWGKQELFTIINNLYFMKQPRHSINNTSRVPEHFTLVKETHREIYKSSCFKHLRIFVIETGLSSCKHLLVAVDR